MKLINKYFWIVDTLRRYGTLTLEQLNNLWVAGGIDDGNPLPRRTFMTYRMKIEDMFGITIACNKVTYEYYIDFEDNTAREHLNWILNAAVINDTLQKSQEVAHRIILEDVPSAREHLSVVIEAMKQNHVVKFAYKSYHRSNFNNVTLHPYFVKIFKQLWYVIGYNTKDKKIKTYALDRMKDLNIIAGEVFEMPPDFCPRDYFKDSFGITTSDNDPKRIRLRVEPVQAKYLRALPLHPSQIEEEVHVGGFSVFAFVVKNTYDLREKILSMGSNVEVISPPELKTQIKEELKRSLALYQ